MDHVIENRSARVFLVDPMEARRSMLRAGLRDLGFLSVTQFSSLEDAVSFVQSQREIPDWIITPVFPQNPVNGMSLLGLCTREPLLYQTRVSFLCKPEEIDCLPHAFEMGLYSAHKVMPDMTSQLKEIRSIFKAGERYHWHDPLVAASFLRRHLVKVKQWDDLVHLEKSLLTMYHDEPALMLDLADALYRQGRGKAALMMLSRASHLKGDILLEAEALHDKISSETESGDGGPSFSELYGLRTMVVVDPDEHVVNYLEEVGNTLGIEKFHGFTNGMEAWDFLRGQKLTPDLMVMEWRIPGLSGSQLVQRLRKEGSESFPLVVYSALVKSTADKVLLRELGISEVILKPVDHKKLKQILTSIVMEDKSPTETKNAERVIRQFLQARRFNDAKQLFEAIEAKSGFREHVRLELEGTMAYYQEKYEQASHLAIESMHIGGQTLTLLNLLGKIYMKLRRFDEANRFFEKAKEISPGNIERLTQMAESHAEQGKFDAAGQILEVAKAIDKASEVVIETDAKVALASGDTERATAIVQSIESVSGIVAFMNNRAVAMVNEDRFAEAIDLYKRALRSMTGKSDVKAVIYYNLALALIKQGDIERAYESLRRAAKDPRSTVHLKAVSLCERTRTALEQGIELKLQTSAKAGPNVEQEEIMATDRILPTATGIDRGTMRLHMVFQSSQPLGVGVSMMVQTIPRFKPWK